MDNKKFVSSEMIKQLAAATGLYEYQVRSVMMKFVQFTLSELAVGGVVHILSLGKFWAKRCDPQTGWDPYNKKRLDLGVRYVPKFTFGKRAYGFVREEATRNCARKGTSKKSK